MIEQLYHPPASDTSDPVPTGGVLSEDSAYEHLSAIQAAFDARGWPLQVEEPWQPSVWAVRNDGPQGRQAGWFNDVLYMLVLDDDLTPHLHVARGTVDPDAWFLRRPLHPRGAAITLEGVWFEDLWRVGVHKTSIDDPNGYPALVQASPVIVARDHNRDGRLSYNARPHTGRFGINMHTRLARPGVDPNLIAASSAGCWVHMHAEPFHTRWMPTFARAADAHNAPPEDDPYDAVLDACDPDADTAPSFFHPADDPSTPKPYRVSAGIFLMSDWRHYVRVCDDLHIGV